VKVFSLTVLLALCAAGTAAAQTFNDVEIRVGLYTVSADGGEHPAGMWGTTGPIVIGRTTARTFALGAACDAWSLIGGDRPPGEDATAAWKIVTTPLRVVNNAVTFRLQWVRVSAMRKEFAQLSAPGAMSAARPGADIELTLRPGQSWPVDSMALPPGNTVHGKPCPTSAVLRASAAAYPSADADHRLVLTELWLVEQLADGTEVQRSQPQAIRGVPNQPHRFYFDSVAADKDALDLYGMVVAALVGGDVKVDLETRARWKNPPTRWGAPHGSVESQIVVTPGETVEIKLPAFEHIEPFSKRRLAIRVRARQIR
jgi:hypothetical protein